MPLEPASQALLAEFAKAGAPPIHLTPHAISRITGPVTAAMSGPGPDVAAVRDLKLDGAGGRFRVRVLTPEGAPRGIVVYFHGGGWVLGDIDLQYDNIGRRLANLTGTVVVLVNYRKAPEHPFPTAVEDSWTALGWVAEHAAELAPEGGPLVVAGDSAGGNLAAVMALRARDRGGPDIAHQVLVYPVTDCDFSRPSYVAPENQLLLGHDTMVWFWDHYLPDPAGRSDPDAAPLRAASHEGLPPALVVVAEFDPLHDEGVAYAEALRTAGVPVDLERADGEMHAFFQMIGILPGAESCLDLVANHLTAVLRSGEGA